MPNLVNPYRFGVAAPWTPASLTGIAGWLRADDLNAQADASAVSSWVDRTAAADFAQATGTKQPKFYKTTSARLIGGQPTVSFDGGDLLRFAGTIGTPTSGHVFIVCQINTLPAGGGVAVVLSSSDEVTTTRLSEVELSNPVTDTLLAFLQRNNDTGDLLRGDTVLTAGTDYVLEVSSTGTLTSQRVNNVVQTITVATGVNNGDWFGDTSDRDNVVLGCRKNTAEAAFFVGDIAEVILVNNANLTAGERTNLNSYLNSRYGFTL